MKFIQKYYWLICIVSFSILSLLSYGFIKDLYFWHEDFVDIKSFYTNEYIEPLYQGAKFILYPFFLLFADKPMGYFVSALVLYILLSLTVAFFIYSFTKNRLMAYLSGIIFSSGYVGSENMQMVATAIPQTLYMILALLSIISYRNTYLKNSIKYWILSFVIFIFSIKMIPDRAFTLILLILLTEVYLVMETHKKNYLLQFKTAIKRLSLFIVSYIFVYKYAIFEGSSGLFNPDKFNTRANLIFFADVGRYLFPSDLVNSISGNPDYRLAIASIIGVFLLLVLFVIFLISRKDKSFRNLFVFLVFSWLLSYFPYHFKESSYLHSSTFRYMFFAYPFFAMLLSSVVTRFFLKSKTHAIKFTGFILIASIISLYLYASNVSSARKFRLERSFYLQRFLFALKEFVPDIQEKTLFYFINSPKVGDIFSEFFAGGRASGEAALGLYYRKPSTIFKITTDYNDFVSQYKTDKYKNAYAFYYSDDHKLINLTSDMFSNSAKLNTVEIPNNKITPLIETDGLSIDASSFPSYRPIQLDINMRIDGFGNDIGIYPYPSENPIVSNLSDLDKRRIYLDYLAERKDFKINAKMKVNSSLGKDYTAGMSVDNDSLTSWIANKQRFFDDGSAWIEITLPQEQDISEIRWISTHKTRLSIDYDYQVLDSFDGTWKTILSVRGRSVQVNKYVVDSVSRQRARKLKIIIYKTNGDSPAISEVEVLKESRALSSEDADTFVNYPLAAVSNRTEAEEIINILEYYQKIRIYPLTNKYNNKAQIPPIYVPIHLDGNVHRYSITIPPSGMDLKLIIIEFPRLPLSAEVNQVWLTSHPLQ